MFDIKKHRQILFDLITDIYRSDIGNFLGFKGGTMAYFFYKLDRFSVDLDFDLLDNKKIETILKTMPSILNKFGRIKDQANKKFTIFYLLDYNKGEKNIKVEISKRKNLFPKYQIVNFYGTDIKILDENDAFTSKLLAATTRKRIASRDFYDIYFYLKKARIVNDEIIKNETGKETKEYLEYLVKFTEKNLTSRTVLHGLGELINEKQKIWIKENLKKELINRLSYLISQY